MEITGTVTQVFPIQQGTSKSSGNAWQKQSFIVEYVHGEYPKQIMLDTMDEKVIGKLKTGMEISVKFDFTVRSWQKGPNSEVKYFNEPRIWRDGLHCIKAGGQQAQGQQAAQPASAAAAPANQPTPPPASAAQGNGDSSDDLPF